MKLFSRPYWIFLSVTLPQGLIVLYFMGVYGIISSLLEKQNLKYWALYGAALCIFIISASAYAIVLHRRRKSIPWGYALLALPGYVVFLFAYFRDLGRIIPFSVPGWMIPIEETILFPLGLVMPVLLHSILLLVGHFTPEDRKNSLVKTAIGSVAVPAFWYLLIKFIIPMIHEKVGWYVYEHVQVVTFIVMTVVFMFLFVRLVYLVMVKISASRFRNLWPLKAVFTLVLPLLCLLIYNGAILNRLGELYLEARFIGDWSHPVYYVLVVINGVLLSLPQIRNTVLRVSFFVAKALIYPFVFYFFMVFLPFLPFSIDAVVFLGFGFLLLTPLILFFFHTKSLYDDWRFLGDRFGLKMPALVFALSFLAVPTAVTVSFVLDRGTLDTMLVHVYEPDYSSEAGIDLDMDSARRILDSIKSAKHKWSFLSEEGKPYLTTYYQWLVLDNLTLSNRRLHDLERIFFGNSEVRPWGDPASRDSATPRLKDVQVSTRLSGDAKYYISRVDLTIKNGETFADEYTAKFRLPTGAWISDYSLVIDGKTVPGILSEKKSALWVYQQSMFSRRDPGILYYTSTGELILRVFPFTKGETRHTSFEVVHRGPVEFRMDGFRISLDAPGPVQDREPAYALDGNIVYLPASVKASLPEYTRRPYLHFILDRSLAGADRLDSYIEKIQKLVAGHDVYGMDTTGAMITFANYESRTVPLDAGWEEEARRFEAGGGMFLERAFKTALYGNYTEQSDRYPFFIVVSDNAGDAVFTDGRDNYAITMPEGNMFLVIDNSPAPHAALFSSPADDAGTDLNSFKPALRHVRAWPDSSDPAAFLPDDEAPGIVIRDPGKDFAGVKTSGVSWENGLTLQGMWMSTHLLPTGSARKNIAVIKDSFQSHMLTPLTAFIAPENDAQRQMLLRKQKTVLSSMRPLDIGEEHEMDEPPLWVLAIFMTALLISVRFVRRGRNMEKGR